jgi:hypothetical protein
LFLQNRSKQVHAARQQLQHTLALGLLTTPCKEANCKYSCASPVCYGCSKTWVNAVP